MITTPHPEPAEGAAHTMALVSAMTAFVSLALPWMTEGSGWLSQQSWNGWLLYRKSLDDGRVLVPPVVVALLVVATLALVLAAWFWQANPDWRRGPKVMPWVGVAYLAGGLYLFDLVTHDISTRSVPNNAAGGIVLWLVSVLLFTSAAGRLRSLRS